MAIANITNNILTDSGILTSALVSGSGTTNYIPKFTGASALGNSALQTDASGNLGLGVTPSAWDFPAVIQLNTSGSFLFGGGNTILGFNAYFQSGWKYVSSNFANYYEQNAGQHRWYNAPSGTAGNAITFTQAMTLTSAGRLLINQTSDSGEQLQVNGSVRVAGVGNSIAFDTTGANATSVIKTILDYELSIQNNRGTGSEIIVGNEVLSFKTNATQRLSIASTGAATFSSTIQTAAPTGGTAKPWKLGEAYTEPCGVPTTFGELANQLTDKFIKIEVDGVVYYIPTFNPSWC